MDLDEIFPDPGLARVSPGADLEENRGFEVKFRISSLNPPPLINPGFSRKIDISRFSDKNPILASKMKFQCFSYAFLSKTRAYLAISVDFGTFIGIFTHVL